MSGEICVIDYKAGNGQSVANAFSAIGARVKLTASVRDADKAAGIVLPGVGAADAAMQSLGETGWVSFLQERVKGGGLPFFGICVGMQMLFEFSREGDTECLGFLKGHVERFSDTVRVPQMGWNACAFTKPHPVTQGLGERAYVYFVNSYYVVPKDPSVTIGTTDYSLPFCSMLSCDNLVATQFHPEKSGAIGLKMLQNFAKEVGAIC